MRFVKATWEIAFKKVCNDQVFSFGYSTDGLEVSVAGTRNVVVL